MTFAVDLDALRKQVNDSFSHLLLLRKRPHYAVDLKHTQTHSLTLSHTTHTQLTQHTDTHFPTQVRADRALRSSKNGERQAHGAVRAVAPAAALSGTGSYDAFIQAPSNSRPVCAAPANLPLRSAPSDVVGTDLSVVPKAISDGGRGILRERMAANDLGGAEPALIRGASKPAKVWEGAAGPPKVPAATVQAGRRSELLDYKQQAIEREKAKELRKQCAIKIQRWWRRVRDALAPSLTQHMRKHLHVHGNNDWRGQRLDRGGSGQQEHFVSSPQLSPIHQQDNHSKKRFYARSAEAHTVLPSKFISHHLSHAQNAHSHPSLHWSLQEEDGDAHHSHHAQQDAYPYHYSKQNQHLPDQVDTYMRRGSDSEPPPIATRANQQTDAPCYHDEQDRYSVANSKSPPIITRANQQIHESKHEYARTISSKSPPIVTRANQQMQLSPHLSPRLSPYPSPHDRHPSPLSARRTASPPIRPLRTERTPPLMHFPFSVQQHQSLRAALLGHRVRHRMRLHPIKSIVGKIQEAARLHLEMKQVRNVISFRSARARAHTHSKLCIL